MLENNILYKIYKSGKIPVIRYKNEGFKNYNQDAYFTIDGKIDEKYKNINGCFCMLGGMQDPYILSGVENTETLNIGYIEADTKVYDVYNKTYTTAKSIFDKALNEYEKIEEELNEKYHKNFLIDKHMDDFDLCYTQTIVNANDVNLIKSYTEEEQKQFLNTINDGFFSINSGINYYYLYEKTNSVDKYLKFIDNKNAFNELLSEIPIDDITFNSPAANDYKELMSLTKNLLEKTLVNKIVPLKSTENIKQKESVKNFIKNNNKDGMLFNDYISLNFKTNYNNKEIDCYLKFEQNKTSIIAYENLKKIKIDINTKTLLTNPKFTEDLSENIQTLKELIKITKDKDIDIFKNILNINKFLKENDNFIIDDNCIIYNKNNYLIEYNFILDDTIIWDETNDKAYHEEDIVLKNKDILDKVYFFRKITKDIPQEKEELEIQNFIVK